MDFEIIIPKKNSNEELLFKAEKSIVIVGANGAGKSIFGYFIESANHDKIEVHRISAQRALILPNYAEVKNLPQAINSLTQGKGTGGNLAYKNDKRWGNRPLNYTLNDFGDLITTLFAYTTKRNEEHSNEVATNKIYLERKDAPIDTLIKIWKQLIPNRDLSFKDGRVIVEIENQTAFDGNGLSDGERVILYLIGQCLCVEDNTVLIIDEPEIHIHKSIISKMWDLIEEACANKLLIYITHDLDFASTKKNAHKFWIKSYNDDDGQWDWDEIPEFEEIPEDLAIEILGSRKNILFVEGEKASIDDIIYSSVFSDYHIIPRGSCFKVIETTKATRETPFLNHVNAFGIIDSDYRTQEEIKALKKAGIFTIKVSEIENLFCIEPIIKIIAIHQRKDADEMVQKCTNEIIKQLENEFDLQVSNYAERQIQFELKNFSKKKSSKQSLKDELNSLFEKINVDNIYEESQRLFQEIIDNKDLEKALLFFNKKNLHKSISVLFDFNRDGYLKLILNLLKSDKKNEIVDALKTVMPVLK